MQIFAKSFQIVKLILANRNQREYDRQQKKSRRFRHEMGGNKMKRLAEIFWVFFKIGLFTIGGGYAMLPIIQKEVVETKGG